ncbi:unnamed protein product [Leptosia nina]|uniref:Uncharacterized protein n=1 Tax=Leptosia nina TaxID=320188 RepID=A0AAV1IW44_9NEOP
MWCCVWVHTNSEHRSVKLLEMFAFLQITDRETSKRPIKTEDSGNWKRRKTSPDPDENDDHTENGHDIEVEEKNKEEMKEMAPASEQGIPKDDELEDWGQSVEEFLDNFKPEELKEDDTDDIDDILEEERKQEDLKEENEKKEDDSETFANNEENDNANTVSRPRSSPRRGRGRRRN